MVEFCVVNPNSDSPIITARGPVSVHIALSDPVSLKQIGENLLLTPALRSEAEVDEFVGRLIDKISTAADEAKAKLAELLKARNGG